MNEKLLPFIVNMFLKLKDLKVPHKGALMLISLFGNPI